MSLQRCKSVPHPLPSLTLNAVDPSKPKPPPRSTSHLDTQRKTLAVARSDGRIGSALTPRVEREDPFSLSGFFPGTLGGKEEEWKWLRAEDSEDSWSEEEGGEEEGAIGETVGEEEERTVEGTTIRRDDENDDDDSLSVREISLEKKNKEGDFPAEGLFFGRSSRGDIWDMYELVMKSDPGHR